MIPVYPSLPVTGSILPLQRLPELQSESRNAGQRRSGIHARLQPGRRCPPLSVRVRPWGQREKRCGDGVSHMQSSQFQLRHKYRSSHQRGRRISATASWWSNSWWRRQEEGFPSTRGGRGCGRWAESWWRWEEKGSTRCKFSGEKESPACPSSLFWLRRRQQRLFFQRLSLPNQTGLLHVTPAEEAGPWAAQSGQQLVTVRVHHLNLDTNPFLLLEVFKCWL